MKAKSVSLEYRPGERFTVDGVKGHQGGASVGGTYFRNAGYGVGEAFLPSLLLLHTQYGGKALTVRVDRFFKERFGKLIESRRELIRLAMPEEISVRPLSKKEVVTEPVVGEAIAEFAYEVVADDLEAWLARIASFTKKEIRDVKKSLCLSRKTKKKQEMREEIEEALRFDRAQRQRENRWRKKMDALVVEEGSKYLKAVFTKGRHRQTGQPQYEFRRNEKLYVLHRQDYHIKLEGEVYVSVDRELVPGRVFLVRAEDFY